MGETTVRERSRAERDRPRSTSPACAASCRACPSSRPLEEGRATGHVGATGFAYIAGGAGSETTMAQNRAAFERLRIVPRVLRDASERDARRRAVRPGAAGPRSLLAPIGVLEHGAPRGRPGGGSAAAARGRPDGLLQPGVGVDGGRAPPRWATPPAGSSSTGPRRTSSSRASSAAPRRPAARRSSSRSTRRCSAGAPATSTSATLPFLLGKGIAQYTTDPVFNALARRRRRRAPGPAAGDARRRCGRSSSSRGR